MNLNEFFDKLAISPETVMLSDTMEIIDALYVFTPVAFSNGKLHNAAGEAERSCRLYAFAQLHHLSEKQTLVCFGEHYREVLDDPRGESHKTIRIFMKSGWAGVTFSGTPLASRAGAKTEYTPAHITRA